MWVHNFRLGRIKHGLFNLIAFSSVVLMLCFGPTKAQTRVEIESPEALLGFFEAIDYTPAAWQAGIRALPRAYIMEIGKGWRISSQSIPVLEKKRIFFRSLAPVALHASELILWQRERLLNLPDAPRSDEDTAWLTELALEYKVIEDADTPVTEDMVAELKHRVDAVPLSLVLSQGAEESGWGTSRFAAEGNALFGQWTWGGEGITPKGQREGMGDYRIAAFDTPLQSVQAYMRNMNTHPAYEELRVRRAAQRANGEALSGWELAKTLTGYSERGAEYVKSLHAIMRVNKLREADKAILSDGQVWHLYPIK